MQLLQPQLPNEGSTVAILLGAKYSPELYCHHNSNSCMTQILQVIYDETSADLNGVETS